MALTFNWLKEVKKELKNYDAIPLTNAPPFPWEELSTNLTNTFECESFIIEAGKLRWTSKEELFANLGSPLTPLTFTFSGLNGSLHWILSDENITILESLLLTKEVNPFTIQDEEFKSSFYKFLILETLNAIHQTSFDRSLIPMISENSELPNEDALCLDITFTLYQRPIQGRLIITPPLRNSLVDHFDNQKTLAATSLTQQLQLPMHLKIGHSLLTLDDWHRVSVGDFILLDHCYLNRDDLKGQVILTLKERPIFKGEIEGNQIRILEYPIIHEEVTYMTKNEEDEDDFSDLGFDEDDDNEEFEFDDDLFKELEEDGVFSEEESESAAKDEEQISSISETSKPDQIPAPSAAKENYLKTDQIPINLTVELGSIQMPIEKLLQIEVGNLLDIAVQPENGVDLTLNGRLVARGELIRLGENLGVRILELG